MKRLLPIAIIATVLLSNCKKSEEAITHINCDGLVTDTLGTGDAGRIYSPNAFTPNADALNDLYRVITKNISTIALTIYDGNNNIAFTTTQLNLPDQNGFASTAFWAPTSSASSYETYYYKIQVVTNSGRHIGACGELYKLSCFPSTIPRGNFSFEDQLRLNGFTGTTAEFLSVCP